MAAGVSRHEAWIYDRGGRDRLFRIQAPSEIKYSRVRDDTSTASFKVQPEDRDRQLEELSSIEPGRHELHIFRTRDAFGRPLRGSQLAWCGPVNLPDSKNVYGQFECSANDVSFYWDRTAMENAYDNRSTKVDFVVRRIQDILTKELARKEQWWNLLDHLHFYVQDGDARTTAYTKKFSATCFDHIDNLAARNGIDYTVVGREQHFWDTSRAAMGTGPILTIDDFLEPPSIKKYGSELATRVIATDGDGGYGISGGTDPYYGEWDIVNQAYDAETDKVKPTSSELGNQAKIGQKGRNPTPLQVTVPENSSVDPRSPLYDLDILVPGVYLPLRLQSSKGRPVQRMQKLQNMTVTENSGGESIQVSLYPASGFGSTDDALV